MEFKDRLMELRKSTGWSQEELGNKLEVTRQTVSKWELGQTTPEMNKLIALSELFGISLDEFIVGEKQNSNKDVIYLEQKRHYEYKSNLSVKGLPLIHINMGYGLYRAKGIIAIGNIATGIIALGIVSLGLISLGAVAFGVLALAGLALGVLSLGALSIGVFAVGGIAIGYLAVGGLAAGIYSIGGCAIADKIALGGYASGYIAVGKSVKGTVEFLGDENFSNINALELKQSILDKFPDTWQFIIGLFT